MKPEQQQAILKRLDDRLLMIKWPIEYARLKEVVNVHRGKWPQGLIDLIDEKFERY